MEEQAQGFMVTDPWTWRDRLRHRLFPDNHCELPEAPAHFEDVLEIRVSVSLSAMDRLRVLLTGKLSVRTRVVCEHAVGCSRSASVASPVLTFQR